MAEKKRKVKKKEKEKEKKLRIISIKHLRGKFSNVREIKSGKEENEMISESPHGEFSSAFQNSFSNSPVLERIALAGENPRQTNFERLDDDEKKEDINYSPRQQGGNLYSTTKKEAQGGTDRERKNIYDASKSKGNYFGKIEGDEGMDVDTSRGEWVGREREGLTGAEDRGRNVFLDEMDDKYSPAQDYR